MDMGTDILKYVFLAGAIAGGFGAIRKWRLRRWQMKQLRRSRAEGARPPKQG